MKAPRGVKQQRHASVKPAEDVSLSFGNFDFQEMHSLGKRGGGVREIAALLRHARRREKHHAELLSHGSGVAIRNDELIATALQRAAGQKVRDDPHRLVRALAKRRNKKRRSAKKWAERLQHLHESAENVVQERASNKQHAQARRSAKQSEKVRKRESVKGKAKETKGRHNKERPGKRDAKRERKGSTAPRKR